MAFFAGPFTGAATILATIAKRSAQMVNVYASHLTKAVVHQQFFASNNQQVDSARIFRGESIPAFPLRIEVVFIQAGLLAIANRYLSAFGR